MMLGKFLFSIRPDWKIVEAENGLQATEKASEQTFQYIFLDFNMPVMDGGQAAKILRPIFPDAKIALLTANVQDSIRALAAELKIDFIPMPITSEKISIYV